MAKASVKKAAPVAPKKADPIVEETKVEAQDETAEQETEEETENVTIWDEMVDALTSADESFKQQSNREEDQVFMVRFMTALGNLDETIFDSLTEEAQNWFNEEVAENLNEGKPINLPNGFISRFVAGGAAKTNGAARAAAPKKAAAQKTAAAPREKGKTWAIRIALAKDSTIKLDALKEMFPHIGSSTVSTIRSDVLATLEAAREVGWKL